MVRTSSDAIYYVEQILQHIGEIPQRPGLKDTPKRVVKSWSELYSGYTFAEENIKELFAVFKEPADEMVVLRDIEFYSMCEHHMLPFYGKAHIGYLPDKGRVVGISKLARLLDVYARRLQIQERIGKQITEAIMTHLKPTGCGVVIEARHFCMVARGVGKQNSVMATSSMVGSFREATVKAEFLRMIGK